MAFAAAAISGGSALAAGALFFARYPRHPQIQGGRYPVGACLTRWDGCPACQIFYPADTSSGLGSDTKGSWFRPKMIDGIVNDYLQNVPVQPWMFRFLECKPAHSQNAPVADCECRFPVVIFSHGLSGSLDMYKTICGGLAANGFVVVALEHEDGSALFSETQDGDFPVRRKPPQGFVYKWDNVVEFRAPFLSKRLDEIKKTLAAIRSRSSAMDNSKLVDAILASTDSAKLYLAGHSFGAATCAMALQDAEDIQCNGSLLFDLWPMPLPRSLVEKGISKCPLMIMNSESFAGFKEFKITEQLAQNSSVTIGPLKISGAAHQSFSDTPCLFPQWIGKKVYFCGDEDPAKVYQAILDAARTFLNQCESSSPLDRSSCTDVESRITQDPLTSKL